MQLYRKVADSEPRFNGTWEINRINYLAYFSAGNGSINSPLEITLGIENAQGLKVIAEQAKIKEMVIFVRMGGYDDGKYKQCVYAITPNGRYEIASGREILSITSIFILAGLR